MKNQKGITLIALVITIIVLLILAGVSISMVVGDNGILNQASTAKTKTAEAEEAQQKALEDLKTEMDNWLPGGTTETPGAGNGDTTTGTLGEVRNPDMFEFDEKNNTILGIKSEYLGSAIKTYDWNNNTVLLNYYNLTDNNGKSNNYFDTRVGWCVLKNDVDTLVIPSEINGKPVYTVKNIGAINVRKVVFEEGIKNITSVYELNSTGLSSEGPYSKPDSSALKVEEVVIPEGVTSLGFYSFNSCTTLKSVTLPSTLNQIYTDTFLNCNNLEKINYGGTETQWSTLYFAQYMPNYLSPVIYYGK